MPLWWLVIRKINTPRWFLPQPLLILQAIAYSSFKLLLHLQSCNSWTGVMVQEQEGMWPSEPEPAEPEPPVPIKREKLAGGSPAKGGSSCLQTCPGTSWGLLTVRRAINSCCSSLRLPPWHCQVWPWEYQKWLLMSGGEGEASPLSLNWFPIFLSHTPSVSRRNRTCQHSHLNLANILFPFLIDSKGEAVSVKEMKFVLQLSVLVELSVLAITSDLDSSWISDYCRSVQKLNKDLIKHLL